MRHQRGFNLIELLIGLAISLVGLAAVSGVMMTFSKKRTAITQTMATQDNGVMALYRLERDVSQAGYGLAPLQSCTTVVDGANSFVPYGVIIADGGAGVSDTITVQGTNPASGVPGTELTVSGSNTMSSSAYNVRSAVGFSVNDRVVATNFLPTCTLTTVTAVNTGATPNTISYTPSLTGNSNAGYLVYFGAAGEFFSRRYSISTSTLTVGDYPLFTASPLVDDIVFLKAQYGLADTTSSTTVTRWLSGATALTSANVGRVVAIRVGVVARSAARENETIEQPSSIVVFQELSDSSATVDAVSYTLPDTRSRYRAYSTIIPLKNVIWTR
ncbi:MAG: PilW family protein [Sulfuritalea sp.]|nr:PilW family protein [Sulfuritalea sp.]